MKEDPRKWHADKSMIEKTIAQLGALQTGFVQSALCKWDNGDCTPNQIKREFWEIISAHHGFKIEWTTPEFLANTVEEK